MAGAEVEYFLVTRDADGTLRPADARDDAARPCYDARGLTRMYDHLTAVSTAMDALGWGNYANDHEDANGQFEQNFAYADALTTADRVITARYVISMLAEQRGHDRDVHAEAVHRPHRVGACTCTCRCGTATSRSSRRGPTVTTAARSRALDPRATASSAGVLDHAPGLQAVLAPTVNSYKRTGATATALGRHLVARPRQLRRQRPHPLRPGPGRPPHRAARRRRGGQPVPGARRPRSPRASTGSRAASIPGHPAPRGTRGRSPAPADPAARGGRARRPTPS